jgi:hypothetical protein
MIKQKIPQSSTDHVLCVLRSARKFESPFTHWIAGDIFEPQLPAYLTALPLEARCLGGASGNRGHRIRIFSHTLRDVGVFCGPSARYTDLYIASLVRLAASSGRSALGAS